MTWRSAGLTRRPVLALAVDPKEAAVVYAGTDAGLFKSTDVSYSDERCRYGHSEGADRRRTVHWTIT
jgi:hypothetical protein